MTDTKCTNAKRESLAKKKDSYLKENVGCKLPWLKDAGAEELTCDQLDQTAKLVVKKHSVY